MSSEYGSTDALYQNEIAQLEAERNFYRESYQESQRVVCQLETELIDCDHARETDGICIEELRQENERLTTQRDRLREALEEIATHDARTQDGCLDEWAEAEAYGVVKDIARAALEERG